MTATVPPLAQLPAGSVLSEEAATSAETEADAEALLVTTVDIGDGKAGKIELRAGDDPMEVAAAFCREHGLPDEVVAPLAQHLDDNMAAEIEQQQQQLQQDEPPSHYASAHPSPRVPAQAKIIIAASGSPRSRSPKKPPAAASPRVSRKQELQRHIQRQILARQLAAVRQSPPRLPPLKPRRGRQQLQEEDENAGPQGHVRLYELAQALAAKQEQARKDKQREADEMAQLSARSMSSRSQALARERASGEQYANAGERMHLEALADRAKREHKAAQERAERERQQLQGLTFTPRISRLAQNLKRNDSEQSFDRLAKRGTLTLQERLQALKQEAEAAEVAECSFHPRINPPTRQQQLSSPPTAASASHYEALYEDAVQRAAKARELAEALPPELYTFRPHLYQHRRHAGQPENITPNSSSVAHRLWQRQQQAQQRVEAARKLAEQQIDPATGRPFFEPQVNPAGARAAGRHQGQSVGDYLYSVRELHEEHLEQLRGSFAQQLAHDAGERHTQARSKKLVEKLKARRLAQIYDYLAEAHKQSQQEPGLDLTRLDPRVLDTLDAEVRGDVDAAVRIFQSQDAHSRSSRQSTAQQNSGQHPASAQLPLEALAAAGLPDEAPEGSLRESGGSVGQQEFVALMGKVLAAAGHIPRSYLLPSQVRSDYEPPTFQPQLTARSRVLAARRRTPEVPTFEVLHATAGATAMKLQYLRRQTEEAMQQHSFTWERLQECTFSPELVALARAAEGRALRAAQAASREASFAHDSLEYSFHGSSASLDLPSPQRSSLQVAAQLLEDDLERDVLRTSALHSLVARLTNPSDDSAADDSPLHLAELPTQGDRARQDRWQLSFAGEEEVGEAAAQLAWPQVELTELERLAAEA